jgi:hypothetical protein
MGIISLNSINKLIFVMVKCYVFFEVGTGFLNIICMNFGIRRFKVVEMKQNLFREATLTAVQDTRKLEKHEDGCLLGCYTV